MERCFINIKLDSAHICIERAVAFLLQGQTLSTGEEEHLFNCDECRRLMKEAARVDPDISAEDSGEKGSGS
jgi:hypothetical protein